MRDPSPMLAAVLAVLGVALIIAIVITADPNPTPPTTTTVTVTTTTPVAVCDHPDCPPWPSLDY